MSKEEGNQLWYETIKPVVNEVRLALCSVVACFHHCWDACAYHPCGFAQIFDVVCGDDSSMNIQEFARWLNDEWRRQRQEQNGGRRVPPSSIQQEEAHSGQDGQKDQQLAPVGKAPVVSDTDAASSPVKGKGESGTASPAAAVLVVDSPEQNKLHCNAAANGQGSEPRKVSIDDLYFHGVDRRVLGSQQASDRNRFLSSYYRALRSGDAAEMLLTSQLPLSISHSSAEHVTQSPVLIADHLPQHAHGMGPFRPRSPMAMTQSLPDLQPNAHAICSYGSVNGRIEQTRPNIRPTSSRLHSRTNTHASPMSSVTCSPQSTIYSSTASAAPTRASTPAEWPQEGGLWPRHVDDDTAHLPRDFSAACQASCPAMHAYRTDPSGIGAMVLAQANFHSSHFACRSADFPVQHTSASCTSSPSKHRCFPADSPGSRRNPYFSPSVVSSKSPPRSPVRGRRSKTLSMSSQVLPDLSPRTVAIRHAVAGLDGLVQDALVSLRASPPPKRRSAVSSCPPRLPAGATVDH